MKHNHNTSLLASTAWCTLALLATTVVIVSLTTLSFAADDSSDNHNNNNSGGGECDADEYPRQQGEMLLYNFETTTSTQDEARKILEESHKAQAERTIAATETDPSSTTTTTTTIIIIPNHINTLVVTADEQTNGRGTNGRTWMGGRGNSFVTIGIRQRAWMETQLSLTLLPVKVGTIMAERIDELLKSCMIISTNDQQQQQQQQQQENINANNNNNRLLPGMTTIKWPNDVLVDEHKISGVLIESTRDWFLIGIGVNVAHAPTVPSSGPNHGRPATSIRTYCQNNQNDDEVSDDEYVRLARTLGQDMAMDLSQWLSSSSSTTTMDKVEKTHMLLQKWRQWVDWDMPLVMRDANNRETVMPVDIELDGRLRIKGENGQERLVVTDYFF